jgi:hypothetical protein
MKPSDKNPKIDAMLTAVFGVDRQAVEAVLNGE